MTTNLHELYAQDLFLGQLDTLLCRGYFSYKQYLTLGKKFIYASIIKNNNKNIVKLILKNAHLFQDELKIDLLVIVYHIDSWKTQWNFLYENMHPKLDDEFIFETKIKFPKNSLVRLNDYYFKNFNKRFTDQLQRLLKI